MKRKALAASALLAALAIAYAAPGTEYVRRSAKLRSNKGRSGTVVRTLSRGDTVSVLRRSGPWRQVKVTDLGVEGWLHKSRLTRRKPDPGTGDSQAVADARATGLGSGRTIRGLKPEAERYANTKAIGPRERQSVNTMIAYRVDPASLDRFMRDGKLGEYSEGE